MKNANSPDRAKRKELAETLERLRGLTDGLDAIIDVTDPKTHRILFANKKAREIYGKEIVGRKCYQIFWNKRKPCSSCVEKRILGRNLGKTVTIESQLLPSGRWFRSTFKAIKWPKERYVDYAVHTDITKYKKLEKERKLYEERLAALDSYSGKLNSAVDVAEVCKLALDAMQEILGFGCTEFLVNNRGRLQTCHRLGYPETAKVDLPLDAKGTRCGVTVKAAQNRVPIAVPDVEKNEDYVPLVREIKSELAVPVIVEDAVFGVLNVESTKASAFGEKDVKLLQILAANAAVAVANIMKRDEIKRGNNSLALLLKTSADLIHSTDPQACLRIMVNVIRECGWNQVVLSTKSDDVGTLKPEDVIAAGVIEEEKQLWIDRLSATTWKKHLYKEYARFKLGEFYFFPWNEAWVKRNFAVSPVPSKMPAGGTGDWNANDWLCAPLQVSNGQIVGVVNLAYPADGKQPTKESLAPIELFLRITVAVIEKDLINQQLVEGEKLFRLLAENAQDVIYRIQVKPELKFEFVSPSVSRISGYASEEFTADPSLIFKIVHPEDEPLLGKFLTPSQACREPLVLRWKRKDGATVWIEQTNRLVYGEHGEIVAVEGIARDITERMLMNNKIEEYAQCLEEKVAERTRKLEETQKKLLKSERFAAIGQLAEMVGHDLRNPLTSIMGSTYYLEKNLDKNANDKMREMLSLIRKNIAYSNKIVNDLLDYSREIVLELEEANPKTAVKEALATIKIPDNIRLVDRTKRHPRMQLDLQKMKRAFQNVIANAVDAMPEGGTLTIESKKTKHTVIFKFSDTGEGIPKDAMAKLWTPLFTTKAKGMGFGLPISKRMVEGHGGSVQIESVEGKGTTISITLPIVPKTEKGGEQVWINQLESSLLTTMKT